MATRSIRSLALLSMLGIAPGLAAQDDLRVMSFNVRYGTARDGEDAWPKRSALVVETIARFDPHVLGLQEALAFQLDHVAQAFPGLQPIGVGREGGRSGEFSALLVSRQRFEVREAGTFWLSPTPEEVGSKGWDAALPRICTWARLAERSTNREVLVLNTHFDHRGEVARLRSARLLARRWRAGEGVPRILLGDLNAGEDSEPLAVLRAAGMRDAFRVVHEEAGVVGTFHGFRGTRSGGKIDYVLVDEGFEVRAARIDRHHAADGRYPSDHYPVTATLRLDPPSGPVLLPCADGPWETVDDPEAHPRLRDAMRLAGDPLTLEHAGRTYLLRRDASGGPWTHVHEVEDGEPGAWIGSLAIVDPVILSSTEGRWIGAARVDGGLRVRPLTWRRASEVPGSRPFLERFESLFDFEAGTLAGWTLEGEAFAQQPTFADGPWVRGAWVQPQGNWYVATHEARRTSALEAGTFQGDGPQGRARSPEFPLPEGRITLLVGGGDDAERTFVRLVRGADGAELARAVGSRALALRRVVWDVTDHAGEAAFLEIVDRSSDAWGHISVDDIRVER